MKLFFPFILVIFMATECLSSIGNIWIQGSGGLLFDTFDDRINDQFEHKSFKSPYVNIDVVDNVFTHKGMHLIFSLGGEYLKNVVENSNTRIETEGYSIIFRAGLIWRPKILKKLAIGHTLGFRVYNDIASTYIGPSIQRDLGRIDSWNGLRLLINSLYAGYSIAEHWTLFSRLEVSGTIVFSNSIGLQYEF